MNTSRKPKYRRSGAWRRAACALLREAPRPGSALTGQQRTYLRWYYVEGLNQREIAERAGRHLSNVSRCLARGERHLVRALEEEKKHAEALAKASALDTGEGSD